MRLAALVITALCVAGCAEPGPPSPEPLLETDSPFVRRSLEVGAFRVEWLGSGWHDAVLRVSHASAPGKSLWETLPGRSFVSAARGEAQVREVRGSFFFEDRTLRDCRRHSVEALHGLGSRVRVSGRLECDDGSEPWALAFEPADDSQLRFLLRAGDGTLDRVHLTLAAHPDERFFGGGVQFSHVDLRGRRVPIWVREQGIGRGRQPLTWLVDRIADSGGSWHTSYAPAPHLLSSRLRSIFLESAEYSVLDLRADDALRIEVWAPGMDGRIATGGSPLELIRAYTAYAGRMRELPTWIHAGAIVGIQGGSERVYEALRELEALETPLAAFWLQDWVGRRDTSFGQQLWWNWELDRDRYPEWERLVAHLRERDIRILTYVNPFLVDSAGKPNRRRDLLAEAQSGGFLVRRADGEPAFTTITDFEAVLVDLTHPAARDWLSRVIVDELVGAGASGWMADFGEALPWDARLHDGTPAASYHNPYPEAWALLNRRVVDAIGHDELVFFARSGFTQSPRYATLFWLGDQLVSWDEHDGIKSAVTGLLSGGLSGFVFNHSDVGGYTTLVTPFYSITRSKELLLRWIELGAFQVVFRTHEGSRPADNHQFDSDDETLRHFSRFAKVHAAWRFYREDLIGEAAETGAPVLRHPWLHFPEERWTRAIRFEEFLIGTELLVAPVLDPGRRELELWLPPGRWIHVWSGRSHGDAERSVRVRVDAPLGTPAVFYREGSPIGERFRANLESQGLLRGADPGSQRGSTRDVSAAGGGRRS